MLALVVGVCWREEERDRCHFLWQMWVGESRDRVEPSLGISLQEAWLVDRATGASVCLVCSQRERLRVLHLHPSFQMPH